MKPTEEQAKTYEAYEAEFKRECREKRLSCRSCAAYDTHDRDCDIYGDYHPPYSACIYAFNWWLMERLKNEKTKTE